MESRVVNFKNISTKKEDLNDLKKLRKKEKTPKYYFGIDWASDSDCTTDENKSRKDGK